MEKVPIPKRIDADECDYLVLNLTTKQTFTMIGGIGAGCGLYYACAVPIILKLVIASVPVWSAIGLTKLKIQGYTLPQYVRNAVTYYASPKEYDGGDIVEKETVKTPEAGNAERLGVSGKRRLSSSNS